MEKKAHIIELFKEHQEGLIADLQKAVDLKRDSKDIDEEDTIDPEDLSHQTESGEMQLRMTEQLNKAKNYMNFLSNLSTDAVDKVQVGAYVETDQMNFLIGVPSVVLDHNGENFMGISTKAPIYYQMMGKKKGDSFSYGKKSYAIKGVS